MKPVLPLNRPPGSICILRLSAIGDCTHVVPIVRTIQKYWPETRISWIVGKNEAALVGDMDGVEFIPFDKNRKMGTLINLYRKLKGRTFDVLLNLQVAARASIASLCIKAPIKVGFDKARARDGQWMFTTHKIPPMGNQHVLDSFFEFTRALGLEEKELVWNIPIPETAIRFVEEHCDSGKNVLSINASASSPFRNWSPELYASLADVAVREYGMQVVLTGGPSRKEEDLSTSIEKHSKSPLVNLVGKTNLKELLAVLDRSTVLVAPDTGPAHMATAVGTPVIGLFASSNPLRSGPYLSLQNTVNNYPEVLKKELGITVEEARWGTRVKTPRAMESITLEQVTDKLAVILRGA